MINMRDANVGLVAVMGLTTVETIKLWQSLAPSLEELRCASPNAARQQQRLMDANYLGAGLAILIGGTTSILLKDWLPIVISLASISLFAWWYRQVLYSENGMM